MRSFLFVLVGTLGAFGLGAPPLLAQTAGPIAPPPKYEVKKITEVPVPPPPPMPADQIIAAFARKEAEFQQAFVAYSYDQSIRVEEFRPDGGVGGAFRMSGLVFTKSDGQRFFRVTQAPDTSLHVTAFTLEDVQNISRLPLFFLTPDQISHYDLHYAGKQKLDELDTYIFQVKPVFAKMDHLRLYFDGVIWVDDRDLAIVKSYGRFVSDLGNDAPPQPFSLYEIYRENFAGKYWFPTYIRSDDSVKSGNASVPIRLVIRSTEVKPESAPAAPSAPSAPPPAPRPPPEPR